MNPKLLLKIKFVEIKQKQNRALVQRVRKSSLPPLQKGKKLNKLKINMSSYIHQRTEIKGKPQSPKLERQRSMYRESKLTGEFQEKTLRWEPVPK